jgi:hypothetical protein
MTRPKIILNPTQFKRMYNKGILLNVIASHFCVSTTVIHKNRKMLHLPLRRPRVVVVDEEEFRRLYADKIIYDEMAKQLGICRCSVISIRKRLNLPARHRSNKRLQDDY